MAAVGPAVFVDRDGTINADHPHYIKSWEEFRFLPRALEALRRLAQLGMQVVVVTNQSAIDRGLMRAETLDDMHRRMREAIEQHGGRLDGLYVCPHTPSEGCACRKPKPGLLLQAAEERGLDLRRSYVVGDRFRDIQAGVAAGCTTIWLGGMSEAIARDMAAQGVQPDHTASDLYEAVEWLEARPRRAIGSR